MKTNNKINSRNIKAKLKFYLWLVSIGVDVKNFDPAMVEIHEFTPKQKSTFKSRSEEIKKRFNHVFKMREQNFLGDYPNIEQLEFNRKTA